MPHLSPMNWITSPILMIFMLLFLMVMMWWQFTPHFPYPRHMFYQNKDKNWSWW